MPPVATILKADLRQQTAPHRRMRGLSSSRTDTNTVPVRGHLRAGAELALGEGDAEAAVEADHFAGRAHFRAEQHVDAGEPGEGKHRFLDADMGAAPSARDRMRRGSRPP